LPGEGEARSAPLALGVYTLGDDGRLGSFAAWARAAEVPVLTVGVGARRALVGPLTVPGHVGCGHCAGDRMRAAAAGGWSGEESLADDVEGDLAQRVRGLVSAEVDAIERSGPSGSTLLDTVVAVGAVDEATHHRFLPLPRCPVCGGAARLAGKDAPERRKADQLTALVDPLTGVIPALFTDPPAAAAPTMPVVVTAAPPHVVDEDGSLRLLPAGWGKGLTPADAVRSALGEAVERYSASLPDPDRIVWARLEELEGDVLDPRLVPLYGQTQYERASFPYVPFDPAVRHPWVAGRRLENGAEVWVPAVLAFLSLDIGRENLISQGTSNGLATGTEHDDAALRAVLELVERDAMMAAWLTGAPGRRIVVDDTLEPALASVLGGIESLGVTVELYLLPTSVCGTATICLGLSDGDTWPGVTMGLGADLDPAEAVRQAILELGQTGPYLTHLLRSGKLRIPGEPESVETMLDHAAFYFPVDRASAFDRLRGGDDAVPLGSLLTWDGERSLEACAAALERAGVRVALVDVTSSDIATTPFRVVRAVSPDLQPISYGYGFERAPAERIRSRVLGEGLPPIHPIW
jgi:ribosomal protein S12 methylthiotransferase accessory factor